MTRFLKNSRYDIICHTRLAEIHSTCIIRGIMILSIELYEENHIVENNCLFNLSNNRVNGKGETLCLNTPICAIPVHLATRKTTVSNAVNGVEVQNISRVFAVAAAALTAV